MNGWQKIIFQYGLPAAMVFFFLGQMAGYIPSVAEEVSKKIDSHQAEQSATNKALVETLKDMQQTMKEQTRIQRTACINAAKDSVERAECVR